jgi:hypothetical protein
MSTVPHSRGVAGWMKVLDQIQVNLLETLKRADPPPPSAAPPESTVLRQPLQALEEHLARLKHCLDQADKQAAEADALLQREAEAARQWIAGIRQTQANLEDRVKREVLGNLPGRRESQAA